MINYTDEVKRLGDYIPKEAGDFWKPEPGQYKVKALTELEEAPAFEKEGQEPRPQKKVKILVKSSDKKPEINEEHNWTMAIGKTLASTYGQLCNLAKDHSGVLKDVEFMIVVISDGTKNSYSIVNI